MSPTAVSRDVIKRARRLRRNLTDSEQKLWRELRDFRFHYDIHVRKQVPIGPYIADFAIHSHKLIIEVDGEFHDLPERARRDAERDRWLAARGYHVIRFTTGDLHDSFDGCVDELLKVLGLMK